MRNIQIILIFIFSPIMIFGACPAMTGSKNYKKGYYYVNQERFDSFAQAKKFIRSLKNKRKGGKNWRSVNKVHTDTPLLGYTKIRNTDISVAALIAVSKRRKTHPQERLTTTP